MRSARHVTRGEEKRNACCVLKGEQLNVRKHLENIGVDGKIMLKRIFKLIIKGRGLESSESVQGQVASCTCEHGFHIMCEIS